MIRKPKFVGAEGMSKGSLSKYRRVLEEQGLLKCELAKNLRKDGRLIDERVADYKHIYFIPKDKIPFVYNKIKIVPPEKFWTKEIRYFRMGGVVVTYNRKSGFLPGELKDITIEALERPKKSLKAELEEIEEELERRK